MSAVLLLKHLPGRHDQDRHGDGIPNVEVSSAWDAIVDTYGEQVDEREAGDLVISVHERGELLVLARDEDGDNDEVMVEVDDPDTARSLARMLEEMARDVRAYLDTDEEDQSEANPNGLVDWVRGGGFLVGFDPTGDLEVRRLDDEDPDDDLSGYYGFTVAVDDAEATVEALRDMADAGEDHLDANDKSGPRAGGVKTGGSMGHTKSFGGVQVKDAAKGEVTAVLATFGVVDSDGDVTHPGAFAEVGEFPISAYNHGSWTGSLPVGKARIVETATEAILEGQFFLKTRHGADTFETVHQLGPLGQWSYGYDPIDWAHGDHQGRKVRHLYKQAVYEGSPVLRGAGVGTRTLTTKSHRAGTRPGPPGRRSSVSDYTAAIRPHASDVAAKAWSPVAVENALSDAATVTDLRSVYAWVDRAADPEVKASYRFPHHHGPGEVANARACVAGIAALNSGRSGLPEADLKGVYEHLAAHLRDSGRDVPDLLTATGTKTEGIHLIHELDEGMAVLSDLIVSASRVGALRAAKGKTLSNALTERIGWLADDLAALQALLTNTDDGLATEYARYVANRTRMGAPA